MSKFDNPFLLEKDLYKRDINILSHYAKDVAAYLSIQKNLPIQECEAYVKKCLVGGKYNFKDKEIVYLERQDNGDRQEFKGGLWSYINDSIKKNHLIAPSFTTYLSNKEKPSLLSKYIEDNVKARAKAKKEMFVAKANKDELLEAVKKAEQTNKKLSNNAISGAHVSAFTPLYNKSAHSTLTSNCRSTSGYGNANNEKLLAGNRHYFNHHIVLNNIVSIVNHTDYVLLEKVINKHNLVYPSAQDTIDCVLYSTQLYWTESNYFDKISNLINNLTPIQRAAFVYIGDLYHIRKHNNEYVKLLIKKLSSKITGSINSPLDIIKSAPEDHLNLAHQICSKETKGIGKDHSKIKSQEDLCTLALTCLNIQTTLTSYDSFIKCFFTSNNLPASVAHFPSSIRRSALTSDTDSTIFTVQDWVINQTGSIQYSDESKAIAATMIFFASATISHVLATMSSNFGIAKDKLNLIAMKNEFSFDVFTPTQLGKHYFANISCQEGNVFDEHDVEIKGVHLKSSNAPKFIVAKARQMMIDIMDDAMYSGSISAIKYLTQVADIEREIIASIQRGEHSFFKLSSIKNEQSYAKEKEKSPYARHTFWNEVFGPSYGEMAEPPYATVKVNIECDNKSKFDSWVNSIVDKEFTNRLIDYLEKNNKTHIPTLYIPIQILTSKGMPKELVNVIDYRKIVVDCCSMMYIVLETLGLYIHGKDNLKRIVSDDY